MTENRQVYKCEICGNIIELLHTGIGTLVCCGQPMTMKEPNTVDTAREKHIPVIEKISGGVIVYVGSVEHPMLDKHYIEWIEIDTKDKLYRKHLEPGEKPEAEFLLNEDVLYARAYCNLHGLWKADLI